MNGSGKSAVLTAITLCLGGKASATNRGASLKSLIRGNEESAILTVRLKNEGSDAYQTDLYGDSIIVERHFSRSGSSGYRLKNSAGRTVSTKKGDVDDLIEYFNLQVDNPMNVLTQDAAKSFIRDSTPAEKYKFFYEGVQLQQLDNDYRLVSDTCDMIESKLDEARKDIKILQKKYEAAEQRAKIVQQHQGLREAAARMRNQLVWVQVEEQEARLQRRDDNITAVREGITEAERQAAEKDHLFQQVDADLEAARKSVRDLVEELVPLTEEYTASKDANKEVTLQLQHIQTEHREIRSTLQVAKDNVAKINKLIDEENQRIENANGGAHSRKLAEIERAQQAVVAAKEALDQSEAETPRLAEEVRSAENRLRNAAAPFSAKKEEVEACESRIHNLKANGRNIWNGYDPNMQEMVKVIERDGGFREKPVGPMGRYVTLLKPMWSDMIEAVFGRNLSGFIVTSKADQMRLSSILKRYKMEQWCPVLIGNHHPIDTTGHEPDSRYETILRVLQFDNELVRRQLIIQHGIEQSLLIRKRDDGYRTMYHGPKPKNTKCCYTLHDSRKDAGHRMSYGGRNQNEEDMSGVKYRTQKPRMKSDVDSQIHMREELLSQLQRELKDLKDHQTQLQKVVHDCKIALESHRRTHQTLKVTVQRAETRVETLQSELDRDNVEDGRLDAFNKDLADAQNELAMYEETYINALEERKRLNEVAKTKKSELDAVKMRVADQNAKIQKAQLKEKQKTAGRSNVLSEKNRAIEQIAVLNDKLQHVNNERDEQAEVVADYTQKATNICERVPISEGETQASLDAKYKKIQQAVKTYNQKLGGSDEQIMLAQEEALRLFQSATNNYEDLDDLLLVLKQSFMKRMDQFRRFQRHISARARIAFSYLLLQRAFRGKLSIDHKTKLLDVHVEPDETTKSGKGRKAKTLSGGEKSFSSICLLLALWEAMGAPLRCLDEYDVFMDDVNRDVSTKMIVSSNPSTVLKDNH